MTLEAAQAIAWRATVAVELLACAALLFKRLRYPWLMALLAFDAAWSTALLAFDWTGPAYLRAWVAVQVVALAIMVGCTLDVIRRIVACYASRSTWVRIRLTRVVLVAVSCASVASLALAAAAGTIPAASFVVLATVAVNAACALSLLFVRLHLRYWWLTARYSPNLTRHWATLAVYAGTTAICNAVGPLTSSWEAVRVANIVMMTAQCICFLSWVTMPRRGELLAEPKRIGPDVERLGREFNEWSRETQALSASAGR